MPEPTDLGHPVYVHFYRAVVGHMDVWRQRMDATTNWAAATTAAMVTFSFGSVQSPHFVLLLALGFNGTFLIMESRRYQIFDLWRRRFRTLNRYMIAPALNGRTTIDTEEAQEALSRVADDLGRMVPHLALRHALGHRIRRNYAYLLGVGLTAWLLKLDVHPTPATTLDEFVRRAAIGLIPGTWVLTVVGVVVLLALWLAVSAPSEGMMSWAEVPSPLRRFFASPRFPRFQRLQHWKRGIFRSSGEEESS